MAVATGNLLIGSQGSVSAILGNCGENR